MVNVENHIIDLILRVNAIICMSQVMRKPAFGVSPQVRRKPNFSANDISDIETRCILCCGCSLESPCRGSKEQKCLAELTHVQSEQRHEKTNVLHMLKQRCRSASR